MNQLKTAFLIVALTVLLVLIGRLWLGDSGTVLFFGIALVMNGVAYWFSDRIALASARAREVSPAEAPMLFDCKDRCCETTQIRGERAIARKRALSITQDRKRFDVVERRHEFGDPREQGEFEPAAGGVGHDLDERGRS